jgi:hypothetical protein
MAENEMVMVIDGGCEGEHAHLQSLYTLLIPKKTALWIDGVTPKTPSHEIDTSATQCCWSTEPQNFEAGQNSLSNMVVADLSAERSCRFWPS